MSVHPHSRDGLYDRIEELEAAFRDAVKKLADMTADRDEWKRQHENLLAVRQQDLAAAFNVSVDDLGWHKFQCPLCDGNLMCAKEALLAAAWCCEEGQRLGVKVCPACAATGAAYTAAMSPEQP